MYLLQCFLYSLTLFHVYGLYTCSKIVKTPFFTKDEFIECFSNANFFYKYIEVVKGTDIEFVPLLQDCQKLQFPQIIKYRAIPDIPFIPSFMLSKINIHQKWLQDKESFVGEIHTKFLTFDLILSTTQNNGEIIMNMEGKMKEKVSLLPDHTLDILIDQFGGIFTKIMNDTNSKN